MSYKQRRPIIVSEGGTGQITLTNHGILVGAATTGITQLSVGLTNTVLLGNTAADPSFGTVPNAALTNSSVTLNNGNNITVTGSPLSLGGTASFNLTGTTNHAVQIGNASGSLTSITVGTTGQVLTGVTGADPVFASPAASSITITGDSGGGLTGNSFSFTGSTTGLTFAGAGSTETLGGTLVVGNGGTGAITFTSHGVLLGNTTSAITSTAAGTTGQVLTGVTGLAPTFQAPAASSISITGDTGGALTGAAFTFAGGTTGLSFGGSGSTETLTFAGITANGGTVSLATDATTSTLNIGTGAGVKTTTLGSTNSTSTTTVQSGSGALNVTATGGALTINSGTGALGISTDASATTVSIATGAAAKTLTIGSTNTTSQTTVQSGSNALTLTTNGSNANIVLTPNGTGVVTTANNLRSASISFDGGTNLLSTYKTSTTWTPTMDGLVSGTTTYTVQQGFYFQIGVLVFIQFLVQITAATGTGNIIIGGLPFTIGVGNPMGPVDIYGAAFAWPAGATAIALHGINATKTMNIFYTGTNQAGLQLPIANTAITCYGSMWYSV